eukprot:11156291-Prorocentrum_lima.AAC.1
MTGVGPDTARATSATVKVARLMVISKRDRQMGGKGVVDKPPHDGVSTRSSFPGSPHGLQRD